ncbi:MAG: dihydropteroate synthase [Gemmatimonadales bacterium]|nr:MAG: dihydropteroate synthase [Gemmatimonadales bacterium]
MTDGIARPAAPQVARHTHQQNPADIWQVGRGSIPLDPPVVVGILNVTPDSFSDGGAYLDPSAALRQAERLLEAGAGMIDVGAESTRPGAVPVPEEEEWRRLEPVLHALVERYPSVPVSVDTVKASTARRALEAGAWVINDVSGLRLDPRIADVCAEYGAGLVLMHSRGGVGEMASYRYAEYTDLESEVVRELDLAIRTAEDRGVPRARIVVDPGLGFSKTPEQTLRMLRRIDVLAVLGCPIMVGPSRKRFLGAVTGKEVGQRDLATAAACVLAYWLGASLFRVHSVEPTLEALAVARAVRRA